MVFGLSELLVLEHLEQCLRGSFVPADLLKGLAHNLRTYRF